MKMKKVLGSVVLAGVLGFSAVSAFASDPAPKVEINGVSVIRLSLIRKEKER